MKMYLRHIDPELRKRFSVTFGKKPKGSKGHARDCRIGEGLKFPFPEDLQSYVEERDQLWEANFRELPTKELEEAYQAARIIAKKSMRRGEIPIFTVDLKSEEAITVEKSTGKILAPERV
jgi:hypothetical protein